MTTATMNVYYDEDEPIPVLAELVHSHYYHCPVMDSDTMLPLVSSPPIQRCVSPPPLAQQAVIPQVITPSYLSWSPMPLLIIIIAGHVKVIMT